MLTSTTIREEDLAHSDLTPMLTRHSSSTKEKLHLKADRTILIFAIAAFVATPPYLARSQSLPYVDAPSVATPVATPPQLEPIYLRPTHRTMVNNYVFDAFGPYPLAGAALAAGINQFSNAPPEWHQGIEGYAKRFGSDFGMAGVATTSRYALSQALREDTLYYRCECTGVFPRLSHAVLSTVTARHGQNGHRTFSLSSLLSPYVGSTVAVYGWYPDRYGAKDALRLGNYNLLAFVGGNVALEFFYSGPHSLLSRMHLNNSRGSPEPGPNH